MDELTQHRIKSATAFWAAKVDACNGTALTATCFREHSAAVALAGRYAEEFLREIRLLLANDEVMK